MTEIVPNVFLIGVQKSATTSVYDWIAQHPMVCGPVSMKDTPFFIDDKLYNKGLSFLSDVYKIQYENQQVILNGCANNIYFTNAIERIHKLNPHAKMILILRNPVDRAISAYKFSVKRNMEQYSFRDAIDKESERLETEDFKLLSNNTYVDHGFYYKQIKRLYQYFDPKKVCILLFEDLKNNPLESIREIYRFIEIDDQFNPSFKTLNKTGTVRFKWMMKMIYNDSKLKQYLMKNIVDRAIPYDLKYRTKLFFLNLATSNGKHQKGNNINSSLRQDLIKIYQNDIENLEELIQKDLSNWKKN